MSHYTSQHLSELYINIISKKQCYVTKVGTYILTDQKTGQLNKPKIEDIVNQLADLHKDGKRLLHVTSGAVSSGESRTKGFDYDKKQLSTKQALAAIGQWRLMELYGSYFERHGIEVGQILPSYYDLTNEEHKNNFLNTICELHRFNAIPILNENDPVSTEELKSRNGNSIANSYGTITFGDNDRLAVMSAEIVKADVLFLLSKEDGLLDYTTKIKIPVVGNSEDAKIYIDSQKISSGGTGGMETKLDSIVEATNNGIFVVLLGGLADSVILRVLDGEPLGTLFLPKSFKY